MMYVSGTGRAMYQTLLNFFRPVVTEGPRSEGSRAVRYRASFALVHNEHGEEACIGCKLCEKICPSDVIDVAAGGKIVSEATGKKRATCDDFTLNLQACLFCELCVQVCPTDAIVMLRVQEEPSYSREGLVLTMDKLYANEQNKPLAWGTGSKLMAMQDPKKGQPPKVKKPKAVVEKPVTEKPITEEGGT
ncbi:MAG: 4Fe-4S dicluster domain-containing protein [Rhodobacterales bacterium]|nr:4Fe-4S dicluster domain-containing protein [Rhodobacterales bacterium]